jgi:hypothetical protein
LLFYVGAEEGLLKYLGRVILFSCHFEKIFPLKSSSKGCLDLSEFYKGGIMMCRTSLCMVFLLVIGFTMSVASGQSTVKINFQSRTQGSREVPQGYLPDYGDVFGDRGNGFSYGWTVDKTSSARDRDTHSDQRYDTLNCLTHYATGVGDWEIELPNATYDVYIVGGDPGYTDQTNSYIVEGIDIIDPTPGADGNYFDEYTVTVTVNDGRLTIEPYTKSDWPVTKICFVHIVDIRVALPVSPANDSVLTGTSVTLEWLAGVDAIEHDVYIGEDFDEVSEATTSTPDIYKGRQSELVYPATGTLELEPGKTYYWRIDEFDGINIIKGGVSSFTIQVVTAYSPEPVDGGLFVDPNTSLHWSRGVGALMHHVYFGDSFESVRDATTSSPEYKGMKVGSTTTWDPPDTLELNKTYYWRIDEQTSGGTVNQGDVWSFTTSPRASGGLKAQYYGTEDLTGDIVMTRIDPEINFDWGTASPEPNVVPEEGFSIRWAGAVEIPAAGEWTFWTHADDGVRLYVNGQLLIEVWGASRPLEWDSSTIILDAGIYPIVMEFYDDADEAPHAVVRLLWQGPLISDRQVIPAGALQPPMWAMAISPVNGAVNVDQTPTLQWDAGDTALEHDVYFSMDYNDVAGADITTPDVYRGRQALDNTSYIPTEAPLEWNRTYYWRVDEVNGVDMWKGSIWSFTVADFASVDDFESYNDLNPDEEGSKRIYLTWIDGFENPSVNGSTMGYPNPDFTNGEHFVETDIVHSGNQSAPLFYDNSTASYSEVTVSTNDLKIGHDWSGSGAQALVLWFYGDPGNATTEQLYVKINGIKVVYDGDPDNITVRRWTQWNIDLTSIGVNLGNVTTFSIGFESTGAAGDSGMVLLDDIRLYKTAPPEVEPVDPGTDALVTYYAFENNTNDSSGNDLNGIIVGEPSFVAGPTGMALALDGVNDYVDCGNSSNFDITEQITLSAWVNTSDAGNGEHNPFVGKGDHTYVIKHYVDNVIQLSIYDGGWFRANVDVDESFNGEWRHVAGTYDGSELKLYIDGGIRAATAHVGAIEIRTDNLTIGTNSEESGRFYNGIIDEVRIYNRALSEGEVLYLVSQ